MSLSQFKSVPWAQVKHWPQGRSRPAGGRSQAQVWVKEEGHSSRKESLAPGAVLRTRKCISSARQGRQVFRGSMEALVRRCPGQRWREGWNTEAGSAVKRGFCWGRKRAREDSGWSNTVAGPGGLGPGWLVSSAAGRMCRTLALGRCRVALEAQETAHRLALTARSTGKSPLTKTDLERLVGYQVSRRGKGRQDWWPKAGW